MKISKQLIVTGLVVFFLVTILAVRGNTQGFLRDLEQNNLADEVNAEDDLEEPIGNENEPVDEPIQENEAEDIKEPDPEGTEKDNKSRQDTVMTGKTVYLTFDDGPTALTPRVLEILNHYDINASFFVIGKMLERNPEIAMETLEAGNAVLPHSYSHDYAIYSTFDSFYEDFDRARKTYEEILGKPAPVLFRFPGGSGNHSSFEYGGEAFMPALTEDIIDKGYYYIDWNVTAGDTGPDASDSEKMLSNVLEGIKGKDTAVVLFHDVTKNELLLEILPKIIETLMAEGYNFKTLENPSDEELSHLEGLRLVNRKIIR